VHKMRILLTVPSRRLLVGIIFSISLSIQNWTATASDFPFFLPERIKPKRIAPSAQAPGGGFDMLERALEGARPEMVEPYETKLRVPGNPADAWLANGYCLISDQSNIPNKELHSHIFAVATHTFQMWGMGEAAFLGTIGAGAWAPLPLHVLQGNKGNTAYQVVTAGKRIKFFGAEVTGENDFEYDVVAHEAGHAVLDHLRPAFRDSGDPFIHFQLRTLHEAFGDVTAIFSSLRLAALDGFASEINNLFASGNAAAIAPHYGENDAGLRNHTLVLFSQYEQYIVNKDYHKFSQIVTGLTYGIIFDLCTYELAPEGGGSAINTDFTRKIRAAFLKSFLEVPINGNVMSGLATELGKNLKEAYSDPSEEMVRGVIDGRVKAFQRDLHRILVAA
jgi:hypothetical protein